MKERNTMLYLDAGFGISGDMTVAALLDLGADREVLQKALNSLPLEGYRTEISRVKKSAIDCCDFSVILDAAHENHDHDMDYLYGNKAEAMHGHMHTHAEHVHEHSDGEQVHTHEHSHGEQVHTHEHSHGDLVHAHEHSHGHGGHVHRGMSEIREILAAADMTEGAHALAIRIFEILAEAEAKAHGIPAEQVHFHEVGAVDSIVDITAAAVCFDSLQISEVIIPRLGEGRGMVRTQHGLLPIPVPAVQNIAEAHGLDLEINDVKGEYVTPTGAAIAAAIRTTSRLPRKLRIVKTGLGAGKREQQMPGILRAMLIEPSADSVFRSDGDEISDCAAGFQTNGSETRNSMVGHLIYDSEISTSMIGSDGISGSKEDKDYIYKLESNIDDCSGETLGYVLGLLLEEGARDVHYTPVYMKKNRPGWQLNVVCTEEDIPRMEEIIFRETTTIGIRRLRMERSVLPRRSGEVSTPYGPIRVKIVSIGDMEKVYPEYSSVQKAAREHNVSYEEVYWEARNYGKKRI